MKTLPEWFEDMPDDFKEEMAEIVREYLQPKPINAFFMQYRLKPINEAEYLKDIPEDEHEPTPIEDKEITEMMLNFRLSIGDMQDVYNYRFRRDK